MLISFDDFIDWKHKKGYETDTPREEAYLLEEYIAEKMQEVKPWDWPELAKELLSFRTPYDRWYPEHFFVSRALAGVVLAMYAVKRAKYNGAWLGQILGEYGTEQRIEAMEEADKLIGRLLDAMKRPEK